MSAFFFWLRLQAMIYAATPKLCKSIRRRRSLTNWDWHFESRQEFLGSYLCRQREESTWNSEACLRSQLAACQALWCCVNPRIAIIMSSWFWLAAKNEHYWSSKPEILALISRPRQDSKLPVSKNHVTQALKAFEYRVVYCNTL